MTRTISIRILGAVLAVWASIGSPGIATAQPETNVSGWSEDLDVLFRGLQQRHPDLFHAHPRPVWEERIAAAKGRLATLDAAGFLGELQRIMALTRDGHSGIRFYPGMMVYPLAVEAFHDGFFIVAAVPELEDLVGKKIVAVGDTPTGEALKKASGFLSVDNEESLKHRFARALRLAGFQRQIGLVASSTAEETFTVPGKDGTTKKVSLLPREGTSSTNPHFIRALGDLPEDWVDACPLDEESRPGWLRDNHRNYWFEVLDDSKTVYLQYNVVGDAGRQPLSRLCTRMFRFIENQEIDRLIIDLRHNSGGNGYLNQSLIHGLIRCDRVNRPGHLFVVTSGKTFSAAVMACNSLEKHTQALFVGEPIGAPPNHYGDAEQFTLPHSGVAVSCSTVAWGWIADPRDRRKWIAPDIPAPISFEDYREGRDPALEAIRSVVSDGRRFPYMAPNTRWYRESQSDAGR